MCIFEKYKLRRFCFFMRKSLFCKILICVAMMTAFAAKAEAQNSFYYDIANSNRKKSSAEMGISLAGVYMFTSPESTDVVLKPRIGIRGALSMAICWQKKYALQFDLAYLYNKVEAKRGETEYDVKAGTMEIPVMFSYRGIGPLRLNAGLVFSVVGTGRYDLVSERIEFGSLRPLMGYTVGVGVNLTQHLLIESRFTGGFKSTMNYFEGAEFYTRSSWLTLGIGYMF